jgi:hypothetical protein
MPVRLAVRVVKGAKNLRVWHNRSRKVQEQVNSSGGQPQNRARIFLGKGPPKHFMRTSPVLALQKAVAGKNSFHHFHQRRRVLSLISTEIPKKSCNRARHFLKVPHTNAAIRI